MKKHVHPRTQRLSVGSLVHYTTADQHWAAIVTAITAGAIVELVIFPPGSPPNVIALGSVPYSKELLINTWHWIEDDRI